MQTNDNTFEVQYDDGACPLYKKYPEDAGWDLSAMEGGTLYGGKSVIISTGVHVGIPDGYVGIVTARSGVGFKFDTQSHVGIIDSNYTGEVKVKMFNHCAWHWNYLKDERVAQITIVPAYLGTPRRVAQLSKSNRGADGFGASGKFV